MKVNDENNKTIKRYTDTGTNACCTARRRKSHTLERSKDLERQTWIHRQTWEYCGPRHTALCSNSDGNATPRRQVGQVGQDKWVRPKCSAAGERQAVSIPRRARDLEK
jgi:hypothetical protein